MKKSVFIVITIAILGWACASAPRYTKENRPPRDFVSVHTNEPRNQGPAQAKPEQPVIVPEGKAAAIKPEVGLATFSGRERQGQTTASGELYDFQQLTAGHRYLPFNTMVRVTNMENNLSVQLRINDRGPDLPNRIIDLSFEAAKRLQLLKEGVAIVRIEVLTLP